MVRLSVRPLVLAVTAVLAAGLSLGTLTPASEAVAAPAPLAAPAGTQDAVVQDGCLTARKCWVSNQAGSSDVGAYFVFDKKAFSRWDERTLRIQWSSIPASTAISTFFSPDRPAVQGQLTTVRVTRSPDGSKVTVRSSSSGYDLSDGSVVIATLTGRPVDSTDVRARYVVGAVRTDSFGVDGWCAFTLGLLTSVRDTSLAFLQGVSLTGSVIELTGAPMPPALSTALGLADGGARAIQVVSAGKGSGGKVLVSFLVDDATDAALDRVPGPKVRSVSLTAQEAAQLVEFVTSAGSINSELINSECSTEDAPRPGGSSTLVPASSVPYLKDPKVARLRPSLLMPLGLDAALSPAEVRYWALDPLTVPVSGSTDKRTEVFFKDPSSANQAYLTSGAQVMYVDPENGTYDNSSAHASVNVARYHVGWDYERSLGCRASVPPTQEMVQVAPYVCYTVYEYRDSRGGHDVTVSYQIHAASNLVIDVSVEVDTASPVGHPGAQEAVARARSLARAQYDKLVKLGYLG